MTAAAARHAPIDLGTLFAPEAIAVVGATPRSGIAVTVRDNLVRMGSETRSYFVNPRYDEIDGTPCYPSLGALPERPDQVVLAVNPLRAAAFTAEAARAGIRAVVIPGGGVVEGGEAALEMQRTVARIAAEHRIALLGPNCMGWVDWTTRSAGYIGDVSPWLPAGHVAGLAQSGSVSDAFIHSGTRIGFSRIVSIGAEAVLDLCDHLAYCLDDPGTHAVIAFLEGFRRPERFLALADHALAIGKPILAVKVGRSAQAQAAAVAHSGNLAGEDRVTQAAFEAAGIVRCRDLDELLEAAELFAATGRVGRSVGRGRTAVVAVSTGEASLVADLVPQTGLDLPSVPPAARDAILRELPTMGYIGNPLDPWGAAEADVAYRAAFEALAACGAYDVLVVVHDFPYRSLPSEVEVARTVTAALLDATRERPELLPVFVSLTSGEVTPEVQAQLAAAGGVPLLRGAVEAFSAIARRAWWEARHLERGQRRPWREAWAELSEDRTAWADDPYVDPAARAATGTREARALPERESMELLRAAGVPSVQVRAIPLDADAAVGAWGELGGVPVALKLDAAGVAHKSDLGAVRLGLADEGSVRTGVAELAAVANALPGDAQVRGLLVEPMAPRGVELIIGGVRDAVFGPAVVVGLGGTFAEVLDDAAIRLAPLRAEAALDALAGLRGSALLRGARGGPRVALDEVAALMVAIGGLLEERDDLEAIDLNPVVASADGVMAVDALVVLRASAPAQA